MDLPELIEGDKIKANKIRAIKKQTIPLKRLTQTTLINAMENMANIIEDRELSKSLAESKGIGTPATRAGIIQDLLQSGYITEKNNLVYITDLGKSYIEALKALILYLLYLPHDLTRKCRKYNMESKVLVKDMNM